MNEPTHTTIRVLDATEPINIDIGDRPTMVILRGLPASGKSTTRRQLCEQHPGIAVASNDDISNTLGDGQDRSRKKGQQIAEIREKLIEDTLGRGNSIIVDNTHIWHATISRLREIADKHDASTITIDLTDVPFEDCKARNSLRDGHERVPDDVMDKMHNELERQRSRTKTSRPHQQRKYQGMTTISHTPGLKDAVVCDLDGTLAIVGDRSVYDAKNCHVDQLNTTTWGAVRGWLHVHDNHELVLCTGRSEKDRAATETWLATHGISYTALIMRQNGDRRKDFETKRDLYETHIRPFWNVHLVWEDRQGVVDMWRNLGIACHQVDPAG